MKTIGAKHTDDPNKGNILGSNPVVGSKRNEVVPKSPRAPYSFSIDAQSNIVRTFIIKNKGIKLVESVIGRVCKSEMMTFRHLDFPPFLSLSRPAQGTP